MTSTPALSPGQTADLTSPTLSELDYDYICSPAGTVTDDGDEIVWPVSSQSNSSSPVLVEDTQSNGSDSDSDSTTGGVAAPYFLNNNTNEIGTFDSDVDNTTARYLEDFVLVRGDYGSKAFVLPPRIGRSRRHRPKHSDSSITFEGPTPSSVRSTRKSAAIAAYEPKKHLAGDETTTWTDDVEDLESRMERISLETPDVQSFEGPQQAPLRRKRRGCKPLKEPKEAGSVPSSPSSVPNPTKPNTNKNKPDILDSSVSVVPRRKEQRKKNKEKAKKLEKEVKPKRILSPETRFPAPSSPLGLGARSVVDDISENGDALVQTNVEVETDYLLGLAYDEAVRFMNAFIQHPDYYTSKASRLTFLQALIVELGLVSPTGPTRSLPGTLTAAKTLLRTHAFLNVRDYLTMREQGVDALRSAMQPSRRALIRDLQGREGGKRRRKGGASGTAGHGCLATRAYTHAARSAHPSAGMYDRQHEHSPRRVGVLRRVRRGAERDKGGRKGAWSAGGAQQQTAGAIEFPPKQVVLHPEDASNKVFAAMGRAFLSVNNCAMTVKDLADLSMKYGLVCQNASAAAQAITFFIRSHLQRCDTEQDFPLLLRHVLSGTPRDDILAPALFSRTGGNVSNKDRSHKDENGIDCVERLTCFRRGTTVWYLSKAAGAPCPFARAGIALRDFADVSAITCAEGRKGMGSGRDHDFGRNLKRKRERCGLRRRSAGGVVTRCEDDEESAEESVEERKPPKIKLTLRLRPCLTSMREKGEPMEEEESASSSDSDSSSDAEEAPMDVDISERPSVSTSRDTPARTREPTWTFPPYPIQRRISIPPYTPSEETHPTIYTSPSNNLITSALFSKWPASKPKLELTCVDAPVRPGPNTPGLGSYYHRDRAASMPFSVAASPPPDSDDDFGLGDDDDDDVSFTLSPEVSVKREDDTFAYVWPQAAPSVSSLDFAPIKSESDIDDFDFNDMNNSKRSSTQTVKQERHEELDLDLDALSLSFDEKRSAGPFGLGIGVKSEDGGFISVADVGSSWGQPVDLTQDEPVCDLAVALISDGNSSETNAAFHSDWKDVELLGPDSVRMQEFEDSRWEDVCILQNVTSPSSIRKTRTPLEQHDEDLRAATPQSPNISYRFASLHRSASRDLDQTQMRFMSPSLTFGSPGSLPSSMPTCSDGSPETELDSVGPASPPSFGGPGSPAAVHEKEPITIVSSDEHEIERSAPWVIPGKECPPSAPSRRVVASEFMDIGLSETSAPWERGMVSQEDVEEHLLAPAPIAMMSLGIPSLTKVPFDSVVAPTPEPPLSPQEEAVFQSLCMFPEMGWDTDPQGDVTAAAAQEVAKAIQGTMVTPEVAFADVFAAATRPPSTLRAKRTGKRASIEKEQAHKPECTEKTDEDYNDGDDDGEMDSRRSSHSREKSGSLANANSKGPLRRSKRVANAVATQRNRDRLRKRTASS